MMQQGIIIQSLVLLSDIPTPSFVIDVDSLPSELNAKNTPPYLQLPKFSRKLSPTKVTKMGTNGKEEFDDEFYQSIECYEFKPRKQFENSVGYLHSSVLRPREKVNESDEPKETFLAEVDLSESLCFFPKNINNNIDQQKEEEKNQSGTYMPGEPKAHLVLGLNNHHVGSYYWARSVGMGASMEAPGISFEASKINDDKGILRWDAEGGPFVCNSNDGKRSEWVNFLRVGDNVQLLPHFEEESIMAFIQKYSADKTSSRIYGVSSKGRPLGSEPMVICKWII